MYYCIFSFVLYFPYLPVYVVRNAYLSACLCARANGMLVHPTRIMYIRFSFFFSNAAICNIINGYILKRKATPLFILIFFLSESGGRFDS